ncbi:PHB depolymerase family esterase [Microbacterium karelineae]|uniref:PHB depolymerase family esterase n=1 Tax=Microbacterium karelineae TaxID=2654283 RepID=UPI0018D47587|nr:PHB depolymerase family esterase [Microbacterium karelineae]
MNTRTSLATAAVAAAALTGTALTGGAAQAAPEHHPQPRAVDATVITEVTPFGYIVAAIAVRYNATIDLGGADIDEEAFAVHATLAHPDAETATGPRTVVEAYASSDVAADGASEPGEYIILELDRDEALAAGTFNLDGFTRFFELEGSHTVHQVASLEGGGQRVNAHPGRAIASTGVVNPIVDEYAAGDFAAGGGVALPYRLFSPAVPDGERVPLVVTLHGYGESGANNFSQIAGNQLSVAFADPERQAADPAFVLAPQADPTDPAKGAWWDPGMQRAVIELVEATIAENPAIDPARVYLTGLSMGSYGSWGILPQRSDLFAGAVLVCGAGDEQAAVDALGDMPIWALHSVDDVVVAYDAPGSDYRILRALEDAGHDVTWSEWAGDAPDADQEAAASAARDAAEASGGHHIFTTFPEGTTPLFSHASWIPTYTNDVILDWLFAQ